MTIKWDLIFDELGSSLEEARKKRRYTSGTRLRLKILRGNGRAFLYKTTLGAIEGVLWKLSDDDEGAIIKFAVESTHGHGLFFRSLYSTNQGQGAAGDNVSLENFNKLDDDNKTLRAKLLEAQIRDRLLWLESQQGKQ